jgi:hypothetical protein
MGSNLTRFYFDKVTDETPEPKKAFEDVETIEADQYEHLLIATGIEYTRIDL